MRPVAQKPQEQIVIYSDAPIDYAINIRAKSTTNYIKVTWWDGTVDIENSNTISRGESTFPKAFASKKSDTNANKKIILTSCDSTGKYTGNITWFNCSKNKKTGYFGHGKKINGGNGATPYGGPRNQKINKLDVSTCSQLAVCICDHNSLTTLGDITACRNLHTLACTGNCFSSINIFRCKNLQKFFCNHNQSLYSVVVPPSLKMIGASSTQATIGFGGDPNPQIEAIIMRDNGTPYSFDFNSLQELISVNIQGEIFSRGQNPTIQSRTFSEVYINNCPKLSSLLIGTKDNTSVVSPYFNYIENNNSGASAWVSPSLIGLNVGYQFVLNDSDLNDNSIDNFFYEINTTSKTFPTPEIYVSNNPGSATCTPSIATTKGYTVYT